MSRNVLIMGWFGAKNYQLDKFAQLYRKMGMNPTVLKTSIFNSINYNHWQQWRKEGCANEIDGVKFDAVHLFSGSTFRYHNWLLHDKDCLGHSKIIFDSGPFFPDPDQIVQYTREIAKPLQNIPFYNTVLHNTINLTWLMQGYRYPVKMIEYTDNLNCGRDKLVINGSQDKMLDFNKINKIMKKWEEKGSVDELLFEKSGHLQHYKLNPEEYTARVNTFLNV